MNVALRKRSSDARSPTWALVGLLAALLILTPLGYRAKYHGRILPGVSVAGVALGGLSPELALASLQEAGLDPYAPIRVRVDDETYELAPGDSGVALDLRRTVADAYAVGRGGLLPTAFLRSVKARAVGIHVPPVIVFDRGEAQASIAQLAVRVDRPPRDASLVIDGTDVRGQDAQPGLRLDEEGAVSALADGAAIGSWPLPVLSLASERLPAAVTDPAGAVASAQALLSDVMKLRSADKIWTMTPGELAPMLTTAVREGTVVLDLDRARLESWLTPVTEVISQTARNPRFRFDAEAQRLSLAEIGHSGRRIDLEATAQRILTASEDPRRVVQVAVTIIPPQVPDNATAAELGIRELIHEETSRFVGSPPERIHNIGVAAARFNGLLVAPEAVFSFNDNIGEVSRETGYEKTLIIMDGATRDGVGGGVCQVSTTLFRAAFWSGLPIVERSAHGYRVAYYEQSAPVGLDATVYQPAPDLRFRNDTGSWLLIETSSDAGKATVTFRILGTKPNRDVQMEGPEVTNVVPPPPPRTEVDPTLPPGTTKQVELARNGASVSITRIIVAGEEETREVFRSKYRPTGAVTAIGPASPSPLPSAAP